ncbi:MAG: deoxyribodipyrimidine photo-lyase [Paracoccaceae bacterium]
MSDRPLILWFRRDLRLADQPMLAAAVASGRCVVPLFILDPETEDLGAAAKWRLGLAVSAFAKAMEPLGVRLVLRRGAALEVLRGLIEETGATGVWWSRLYDPISRSRDQAVKTALKADGVEARSFAGHLLHEPWQVATGDGGFYRVFTPYWNAVRGMTVEASLAAPTRLRGVEVWPKSNAVPDWGAGMNRGVAVVLPYQRVGEVAAQDRLSVFLDQRVGRYADRRDFLADDGGSGLSENLTYGEVGPRQVWHAGWRALQEGATQAETFLKELVWREFAYHLVYHAPQITSRNWREGWDAFPWRADNDDAERWRRGMTGESVVDAAMRQMYVTGTMHNRARMIVASYLTKHLLTDWRVGQAWFAECLTDWDGASNAMGWQWVAGSGPDAAPYFRIFNPALQAEKFDRDAEYRRRWLDKASPEARRYFDAVPRSWALTLDTSYPVHVISLAEGRARALAALSKRNA